MEKEQTASRQQGFSITYTVDSFADGIAFGQHRLEEGQDPRDFYGLRLKDEADLVRLRSRYVLHRSNPLHELESHLMRLSRQGVLASSVIYLGVSTDPFFPFEGKFDGSMKFLELFQRYTPGLLIVQTRSPLIVIAMPVLKRLGARASVTIGLETPDEEAVRRYTPGFPRVADRLKTATALRRFGVEVSFQVSPVLPYGDWKKDAGKFAEVLNANADRIYVKPLSDGTDRTERAVRNMPLAKRLAEDRRFHWLRPDAASPLITELEKLAPEKLKVPERRHLRERQMKMFAA
jgi:DNA repair photolyase